MASMIEPVDTRASDAAKAAGLFAGIAKHLLRQARKGLPVHPEELAVLEAAYQRACWLIEGKERE